MAWIHHYSKSTVRCAVLIISLGFMICIPLNSSAKEYTLWQKIWRGEVIEKKYTTCRLAKRVKARNGQTVCLYKGANNTYSLNIEVNCPKQFQCIYNPNQPEPQIDDVLESLNENFKRRK